MTAHEFRVSIINNNTMGEHKRQCPLCGKLSEYNHGNCRSCGHEIQ